MKGTHIPDVGFLFSLREITREKCTAGGIRLTEGDADRMLQKVMVRLERHSKDLLLFALAGAFLGFYQGLYEPSFNNYLNDVFQISEATRGALEFPRELPGFLVAFVSGLLLMLADTRMASLATVVLAAGLFGQGFFAPSFGWMVVWMVTWSMGSHLYMTLFSSIGVSLADKKNVGLRLGQLTAINTAASILGYATVWLGFRFFDFSYRTNFAAAGIAALLGALCFWLMTPRKRQITGPRILIKRRYGLFYLLNILFGARKQIFLTFGPWVLIRLFHQSVATFAVLGIIATILGVAFRPLLGQAIDRLGERTVIALESLILILICFLYGFARDLFGIRIGLFLIFACFIIDQLVFAASLARTTYLSKIADTPADITPSLSMGVTLDHAVAMTIPFFGGLIWELLGYQYVFLAAAIIALFNLAAALKIPQTLSDHSNRPAKLSG